MKTIIIAILFSLPIIASAQQKLTLEQCIDIALQNNRNVKQQKLNRQQREIAYSQARANLLPDLNASANQSFSFGRSLSVDNTYQNTNSSQTSFGISSSVTLFDGLRMKHNIDARRFDMQATEADLAKIEEDIIMSVSTAFLQVLLNKELLQISNDQIALTNANIERRKELVKSGKMAQGELYELEAQAAKEDLNKIQAENNLKLSLLDLAQIMEMEQYDGLDVIPPADLGTNEDTLLSPNSIYESALLNRPEIRGAQMRLKSNEKEVLMAKSAHYPSLSFSANIGTGYYNMSGRTNTSFSEQFKNNMSKGFGFSLSIPIFNRFQTLNSVKQAQITVENSRIEIDKTKLELRKRIEQAYYNALAAQSRWNASVKSEMASREAFRFAEQKYDNGRANSYELFQAKSNLAQVLREQTQAKFEYAFRLKMLELLKK